MVRTRRLPVTLTNDFDLMPPIARAQVMFISSTRLTLKGFLTGGPLVWKMMRRLKRTPGFVCQKGTYRFPLTTGSITFFDSLDALEDFARSPEHRAIARWGMVPGRIRSGFIRVMRTAPTGSAFGEWVPAAQLDDLDRRRLVPIVGRETTAWDASTIQPSLPVPTQIPAQVSPQPIPLSSAAVIGSVTGCPVAGHHLTGEHPTRQPLAEHGSGDHVGQVPA